MGKQKSERILISLPLALLTEVNEYCAKHKYNRAEFIRHAVREVMKDDGKDS